MFRQVPAFIPSRTLWPRNCQINAAGTHVQDF